MIPLKRRRKMKTLKQVLMHRDKMTADEADAAIDEAKDMIADGADPEEVLAGEFGLEPDYIFDLIWSARCSAPIAS